MRELKTQVWILESQLRLSEIKASLNVCGSKYSETPPYSHLVITATFFGRLAKRPSIFLKKTLINTVTR